MKRIYLCLLTMAIAYPASIMAQNYPLGKYTEPQECIQTDLNSWKRLEKRLYATWGSKDIHYSKNTVPVGKIRNDTTIHVWKGERTGVQALLFTSQTTHNLSVRLSDWKKGNKTISVPGCEARFVNYVLTDDYWGCGTNPKNTVPYLVPDVIDQEGTQILRANTTRPVWCTLEIPRNIQDGTYQTELSIVDETNHAVLQKLKLNIKVIDRTLPTPQEQQFHLDMWQQPYAIARYHQVEKWSEEHFAVMKPYMQRLARAGQRVVSAILFYEPWGEQSHDKFDPMIQTIRKKDGTWSYDYTIFDKWVEYMISLGIDRQINCYSMLTWEMKFRYWDEASNEYRFIDASGDNGHTKPAYKELWMPFLKAFSDHLKEKGWFEKTCIAMDERSEEAVKYVCALIQKAAPGMKVALAGSYHAPLKDLLYDYCVATEGRFPDQVLKERKKNGQISTMYTYCANNEPNIFTSSEPAEAAFIGIQCAARKLDGYLHWSWVNWGEEPLTDSRWRRFTPGDTYVIYPGNRSSVKWERLIEGIQDYEKIRILKEEYTRNGQMEELKKLNDAVQDCAESWSTPEHTYAQRVNYVESLLNGSPEPYQNTEEYCPAMSDKKKTKQRWIKQATTIGCQTNLNFQSTQPSREGYVYTGQNISVSPGSSFQLSVRIAQNKDDLRWCRSSLYADWNHNFLFDSEEKIISAGQPNQENKELVEQTFTIQVPHDAVPGESRLRLVYKDAWADEPTACGIQNSGFILDIPMIIDKGRKEKTTGKWKKGTYKTKKALCFYAYDLAGNLLDQTLPATSYSTQGFLPGEYVLVGKENGKTVIQTTFKKK